MTEAGSKPRLFAFGRSRMLLRTIEELASKGFPFVGIVTDIPYPEYGVGEKDFEALARRLSVPFTTSSDLASLPEDMVRADYSISVNWRTKVAPKTLGLFGKAPLNYHLGNLPDYKGNATIQWTMLNGEEFITGNVHRMEAELDVGAVIARARIPITQETYVEEILAEAERLAPGLFLEAITALEKNPGHYVVPATAEGLRCYPRIEEDYRIDWNWSAEAISRLVRCSSQPYPGAYTFWGDRKLVIWRARARRPVPPYLAVPGHVVEVNMKSGEITVACGEGLLDISEIGFPGENRSSVAPAEVIRSIRLRFGHEGARR